MAEEHNKMKKKHSSLPKLEKEKHKNVCNPAGQQWTSMEEKRLCTQFMWEKNFPKCRCNAKQTCKQEKKTSYGTEYVGGGG